jgi:hypothetical protein
MKLAALLREAQTEVAAEQATAAKEVLKERIREIAAAERVLAGMKADLQALLDKDVAEVAADTCPCGK